MADQLNILTERLLLRRLNPEDWKVISYLRSDKEVNKYVERPSAETKEKALEFITKITKGVESQTIYYWAITEKGNNMMIGSICLWNISEDRTAGEVGYDLNPFHQGKGIMSESLKAIIEFGFRNLGLTLIEAYTNHLNSSSLKLLEKNGFTLVPDKKCEYFESNVIYEIRKN